MKKSNPRTFPLFVYDNILKAIENDSVCVFVRPLLGDNIVTDRIYSKIGYPFDNWYVCEPGMMIKNLIYIRKDNTCIQNIGGKAIGISSSYEYNKCDGIIYPARKMPKWAAIHFYEIEEVSFATRIQSINERTIIGMGIVLESSSALHSIYSWGSKQIKIPVQCSIRDAFMSLWDETYGINNLEIQYGENPYITIYNVKKINH